MALESGTKLGTYEITAQIGAGGTGEVYRATNSRQGSPAACRRSEQVGSALPLRCETTESVSVVKNGLSLNPISD